MTREFACGAVVALASHSATAAGFTQPSITMSSIERQAHAAFAAGPAQAQPSAAHALSPAIDEQGTRRATFSMRDDYTYYVSPGGQALVPITSRASWEFRVGDLPVNVSGFRVRGNYKHVSSGGAMGEYSWASYVEFRGRFSYQGYAFAQTVQHSTDIPGQGLHIVDTPMSQSPFANFLLSPGLTFRIDLEATLRASASAAASPMPRAVTLEAGGEFSSYRGFELELMYVTVPTPGTAAASVMLGWMLRRRR